MPATFEDRLATVVAKAVDETPAPHAGFTERVLVRRRRRRARRAGTAVIGALVVAVGIPLAVQAVTKPDPSPSQPEKLPTISVRTLKPAAQVWPDAVVTLPAFLDNGARYRVLGLLDEEHALVSPLLNGQTNTFPVLVDLSTGEQRSLMPDEPGALFGNATVDDHAIIWTAFGAHGWEVFSASITGTTVGPAELRSGSEMQGSGMVTVFGSGTASFALADYGDIDHVSRLFRVPGQGALQRVPQADGTQWTWTEHGPWLATVDPPPTPFGIRYPNIWNPETGEHRALKAPTGAPRDSVIDCDADICFDQTLQPRWDLVAYHRDGTPIARLTGFVPDDVNGGSTTILDGRFIIIGSQNGSIVLDTQTVQAARLKYTPPLDELPRPVLDLDDNATSRTVLDLTQL
jgi:hypothetical protein